LSGEMGEWKWTEAEYWEDETIASWQEEEAEGIGASKSGGG